METKSDGCAFMIGIVRAELEHIGFNFCLKETAGTWEVIMDLSLTDVLDTSELRKFRGNFPLSLLPSDGRQSWKECRGPAECWVPKKRMR
jgi:hypothetical protein